LTGGLQASMTAFGMPLAVGGLWAGTLTMLVLPRVLGILGIVLRHEQRFFGGTGALIKSAFIEAGLSVLQAPVRMVAHSMFVFAALTGWRIDWKSPPREAQSIPWRDAARRFAPSCTVVLLAALAVAAVNPAAVLWMAPIALPLLFAVPLAVLTSQERLGERVRSHGLLTIPEESWTPAVLRHAWAYARRETPPARWTDVLRDPGLFDLVRSAMGARHTGHGGRAVARRQLLLDLSPERTADSLAPVERMRFLSEPQSLEQLRVRHSVLRGQVFGRQLARDLELPQAHHALIVNGLRAAGGRAVH
jgi:membrane glycosyltransferase